MPTCRDLPHPGRSVFVALVASTFIFLSANAARGADGQGPGQRYPDGSDLAANRELARTARQSLVVGNILSASAAVARVTRSHGGYVEYSEASSSTESNLRIFLPSPRLDDAMDTIGALGNETDRTVQATDVTGENLEIAAGLKSAQSERARLRRRLKRAVSIKRTIELREAITLAQVRIERLEATREELMTRTGFARLDVHIRKRRASPPPTRSASSTVRFSLYHYQ